jgi:hypothetical protein
MKRMTDRISAFIVVLEQDMRDDDAMNTLLAIRQMRGVLSVTPHVASPEEAIAEGRIRNEIRTALFTALDNKDGRR